MKAEEFSARLWDFAVRVAHVVDALPDTRVLQRINDVRHAHREVP